MSIEIKVPQLPESVADATLVAWHKKAGDAVRRDENLVDLETDKVVLEVPAPADGVLKEIAIAEGTVVSSGQVLGLVEPGAAPAEAAAAPQPAAEARRDAAKEAPPAPAERPARAAARQRNGGARPAQAARAAAPAPQPAEEAAALKMGPAVRKLLEEHDIDPSAIPASGREGRITKGDVLQYLERRENHADVDAEAEAAPAPAARPTPPPAGRRGEQRIAMTRLRARIAERLVEAQHTAAMLTTFNEIDMSAVMAMRSRYQEAFQARYGIKLGFMSFFTKACIEALKQFPLLNASIDGKDIVYHEYFDIGIAVSTERGLVVPVLRNAETMGFADIERAIRDYGERARAGSLGMEDLTGGTFTITNGGIFGSLMSTPILNPPQSGILGMHKIEERPVAVAGKVEIRPMMYVALTYDHRIVDGREAVQFLVHVKEQIEDPARLILGI
ncbi:MAG TPA: 2-oxoglutarate dehydrogenase complex dihydrolipoyllysine-residue succinyltransferase [Gammaproteobacteria bacterium]